MNKPKLLKCFHTFCMPCIKTNAQHDEHDIIFKCFLCSSQTVLKELNDVEFLQTSPIHSRFLQVLSMVENQKVCSIAASHCEAMWKCLDCHYSLCDECLEYHTNFSKNHKVVSLPNLSKDDMEIMIKREESCKTHPSQDVEWYCQDCDTLICLLCLKDHSHNKHELSSLKEFITNEKQFLKKNLGEIERLPTNEDDRKQQEKIAADIRHYGKVAKEHVKKATKQLVKELIDHEQHLLTEIQKSITKAERNLRILCHTSAAQEYVKYFAENGTASEMIDIRHAECTKKFTYEPFQQDVGEIKFIPNQDLYNQVNNGLGLIKLFQKTDAKLSILKVETNLEAMRKTKLTLKLKTSQGKAADESLDNITVNITPEDDVQIGKKLMVVEGEVTLDLTVGVPGEVTAHVEVRGNPVSNSPVVMNINPQIIPVKSSKKTIDLNKGSNNLNGIAVDKTNDRFAIADISSHCVRILNVDGDVFLTYGSQGSGQGQFKNPHGLAFLGETKLVIADHDDHKIFILDLVKGTTVKTFGCQGDENGQFNHPCGVLVDDSSNIIVCDLDNNRLQGFTKDGDYLYQFNLTNGKPVNSIMHKELLYVSDWNSSAVHVIEMKNKQPSNIIRSIGGKECSAVGQLKKPRGLAIDNDDNLLVCNGKQIYKFTLDGRFIGKTNELLSHDSPYIAVLNDGSAMGTTWGSGLFAI